MDRESLHSDWNGDKVVESIAAMCPNTVVITHSNGVNVMPWADNPNVTAILAGHLPGQEAGNSILDVLWGDVNPSGHLPYTIAHSEDSYSFAPITNSTALENTQDPKAWQSDFKEEVLIDYRMCEFGLSWKTSNKKLNFSHQGTSTIIIGALRMNSATAFHTQLSLSIRKLAFIKSSLGSFRKFHPMQLSSLEAIPIFGTTCTRSQRR